MKNKHKLYTIDAIIYAASQLQKSTLLTGDHHFKDLKKVELLQSTITIFCQLQDTVKYLDMKKNTLIE